MTTLTETECLHLIHWCEERAVVYGRKSSTFKPINKVVSRSCTARAEAFTLVATDLQIKTDSSEHTEEGDPAYLLPTYAERRTYAAFCREEGERCGVAAGEALLDSLVATQVADGDLVIGSSYLLTGLELLKGVPDETE